MGTVKELIKASRKMIEVTGDPELSITWATRMDEARKQLEKAVKRAEEEAVWQEGW